MKNNFQVFFSNKVEDLVQIFKGNIYFSGSNPFKRRYVIVSNPAIKSWLMIQLAKDPLLGIAAGMEVSYLDETIDKLNFEFSTTHCSAKIPSFLEIGLAIETKIYKAISHFFYLSSKEQTLWLPLFSYLQIKPNEPLSKKGERRLTALVSQLAALFKQYGKYGRQMVSAWDENDPQDWQHLLWQQIFNKDSPWTYLYKQLENSLSFPAQIDLEIHLFSISYIPPLFHEYLIKCARFVSLKYYLLSPCQYYWDDIRSDKEIYQLSNFWKNQGVADHQQQALEEFLRDRNPLLANFGRVGREMAELMERSHAESFECYTLSQRINDYPQLESKVNNTIAQISYSKPLSLLQAVQADMLLLRNPINETKLIFDQFDASIQIHRSCTKLREIQSLYDLLFDLLSKHQKDVEAISPEDILVMAPEITEYEPFIKMVFQNSESKLISHILDLHIPSQNVLVQGFLHLLSVPFSRWDTKTLLQLFSYRAFQQKQKWEQGDVDQIERWIKETDIKWGFNNEHRRELLKRDHCLNGTNDQSSKNTWNEGFDRLLEELIIQIPEDVERSFQSFTPSPNVSLTQADLLGQLIKLSNALKIDLKPLSDHTQLNLKEWSDYLNYLFETYFHKNSQESDEEQKILEDIFYTLKKTTKYFPLEKFSFTTIEAQLHSLLSHPKANYRESNLNVVTFCSLLPLRTIPAKIIVLLGLQEDCYPRKDSCNTLNQMKNNPKADYFPSQTDFDRYLFLEALLSARQYFIMSYVGYSSVDFKEQAPALLITEMLNYLDKSYEICGDLPSKKCQIKHPFQAFDSRYFTKDSHISSYSKRHFNAARAYYHPIKLEIYKFIPRFNLKIPKNSPHNISVNLSELNTYAKNPLKTYFNKNLGIYLNNDKSIENNESLLLSYLEFDGLKKASLKNSVEEIVKIGYQKKLWPPGIFKDISLETLREKISEFQNHLEAVNIVPKELYEIEFSDRYVTPHKTSEGFWQLPALKINYKNQATIKIVGKLKDVAPQGLLAHIEKDHDVTKTWPQFLVFLSLVKEYSLPSEPSLIFAKSGLNKSTPTENPHEDLSQYLDYYFLGLEHPSPLIPEWIPIIIKEKEEHLLSKLNSSLQDNYSSIRNEYLDWLIQLSSLSDGILDWKPIAQRIFGKMMNEWFNITE
jgi:exodeoxyribonuclease V gamma subunit